MHQKKEDHKTKRFDWSSLGNPMNRISSSKEIASRILDFSNLYIHRLGKRDKVDTDFVQRVVNIKNYNGLIEAKHHFQETVQDKLLTFYKFDLACHVKIDGNLIPKDKKVSYFEAIKASENLGQGPYKLTRYKVWDEPPKPVVQEESVEEHRPPSLEKKGR